MTAREVVLSRIAVGLSDVPVDERPEDVVVVRNYLRALDVDVVDRFVQRISEYQTTVRRVSLLMSPMPSPSSSARVT